MVEVRREAAPSGARWAGTAAAALFAFLTVGYAMVILVAGAYSSAVDEPRSPAGFAICAVLLTVPFIVGLYRYRRARRAGLAGHRLVRQLALTLIAVAFLQFVALVFLAGPI